LSIDENVGQENVLTIYPNPVLDYLNIDSGSDIVKVEIFSSIGKLKISSQIHGEKGIDVTILNKGLYIVRLLDDSGAVITRKFVKM
jgi:hypothetical protein